MVRLSRRFTYRRFFSGSSPLRPTTPVRLASDRFRLVPLSLATTDGIADCFIFLRVLRCFTSPGSLPAAMDSPQDTAALPAVGFPIRTSTDQSLVGGSPWLIAATHVLHRLLEPRHPPHALSSLVTLNSGLPSLAARATPAFEVEIQTFGVHGSHEDLAVRCFITLRIRLSECLGRGLAAPRRRDPSSRRNRVWS